MSETAYPKRGPSERVYGVLGCQWAFFRVVNGSDETTDRTFFKEFSKNHEPFLKVALIIDRRGCWHDAAFDGNRCRKREGNE